MGYLRTVYLYSVSPSIYLYNFWIGAMCKWLVTKCCSHSVKNNSKMNKKEVIIDWVLLFLFLVQINKSVKMRHGGIAGWKEMLCPFIRWSNTWHTLASRWPLIVSISQLKVQQQGRIQNLNLISFFLSLTYFGHQVHWE